jgi:hypothetical protein
MDGSDILAPCLVPFAADVRTRINVVESTFALRKPKC